MLLFSPDSISAVAFFVALVPIFGVIVFFVCETAHTVCLLGPQQLFYFQWPRYIMAVLRQSINVGLNEVLIMALEQKLHSNFGARSESLKVDITAANKKLLAISTSIAFTETGFVFLKIRVERNSAWLSV